MQYLRRGNNLPPLAYWKTVTDTHKPTIVFMHGFCSHSHTEIGDTIDKWAKEHGFSFMRF
jgi:hypothetical protein